MTSPDAHQTSRPAGWESVSHDDPDQILPHVITAKSRNYAGGTTPIHQHPRAQLIYAGLGVMRVETRSGCWVVPPLRGVWIPAFSEHRVMMLGEVHMRTLYFRDKAVPDLPDTCCLMEVSPLLRELILALVAEPLAYDRKGRGGLIAQLILKELRFTKLPALHLPVPTEPRLQQLCQALIAQPDSQQTLEDWADHCHTTGRTLARLFHKETGMSFGHWRQQARLVDALGRLGKGEPVATVAQALGYRSTSAFTVMFKKVLGIEPSRYFAQTTAA